MRLALKAKRVLMVLLEKLVSLDTRERSASLGRWGQRDFRGFKGHPGLQETKESQGSQDLQDLQEHSGLKEIPDQRALQEKLVILDFQENLEKRGQSGLQGMLGLQDLSEQGENQV